jgi:hypothetical protein
LNSKGRSADKRFAKYVDGVKRFNAAGKETKRNRFYKSIAKKNLKNTFDKENRKYNVQKKPLLKDLK